MKYDDSLASARARASTLSLRDLPPDIPIPIADFARALGWRTQRARRMLEKIHMKHEEPVLVQNGNRKLIVSINRLRQVFHGLGERALTAEELSETNEQLRGRLRDSLERNRDLKRRVDAMGARQRATETRMVELEERFVKATQIIETLTTAQLERPTPFPAETESGVHVVGGALPSAKLAGG